MAAMFTVKDLEVYKDSLKEKKNKTTKPAEKPAKTPPSVVKPPKSRVKVDNEEAYVERRPLSVVHKAGNTIKEPQKPPSPMPVGPSKQADQWRKTKELALKSSSPGKINTSEFNAPIKAPVAKTDSQKSPREALRPKSPHIKSDDSKAMGLRKLSTHNSLVYQRSPSMGAVKAAPNVDVNPSLCSECTRSASQGAVCFIGNDGRVSACTTRSAVRLCKNLNCAANNPEYVAAMANAPKKYLISKRHLLKAQYGPNNKSSQPKSPDMHPQDAAANGIMSKTPSQDAIDPLKEELSSFNADASANGHVFDGDEADLSLFKGSLRQSDEEMSLLDGDLVFDKDDDTTLRSSDVHLIQDAAVDDHTDFSFHDGEAGEPESPRFFVVGSPKVVNEAHSIGGSDNLREDAESLAINSFECDDEDLDGSPTCRESKAEELLLISYGDPVSNEEVDADDQSANAEELRLRSEEADDAFMVSRTEAIDNPLLTLDCERAVGSDQTEDKVPATDMKQDTEISQGEGSPVSRGVQQGGDDKLIDEVFPMLDNEPTPGIDDGNDSGLMAGDADQVVDADDEKSGDLNIVAHNNQKGSYTNGCLEKDTNLAALCVVDDGDDESVTSPLVEDDPIGVVTTSLPDNQVDSNEAIITSLHGAEHEQSNDYLTSIYGNTQVDDEEQSDGDDTEEDGPDRMVSNTSSAESNVQADGQTGMEDTVNEGTCKGQDGIQTNNSPRRQRRRRVLRVVEEANPETVILRKQQMLERKQREEWMLNHAIEGVVHKLAPTGEARVKILVEAFESIISHTDVEAIDTSNARQEKRATMV